MLPRDVVTLLAEKDAEIRRLREQVTRLTDALGLLRAELSAANAASLARVSELAAAVAKSNDRIAELLAAVERKKQGKAPKAKEPESPPEIGEGARDAFEGRPSPPPEGLLHDKPQPQHLPTGRKPLPKNLPRDTATVYPSRCACGCETFDWVDEVVEEKLDVKAHQRVRHTVRKTGRCRRCGVRTTAEAPPAPFERSKVTPEWLAWCVAQKFELHVALDRLRRSLTAQGLPLAISFLVAQMEAAADLLSPIDGEHWKQLLAGIWMATDGTGLKVQIPGLGLHHGYLEAYHRGDLVVFQYEAEKGGTTQAEKLAKFEGALLVDAESRYNETFRRHAGIVEFNCNAHPRRTPRRRDRPTRPGRRGRGVRRRHVR